MNENIDLKNENKEKINSLSKKMGFLGGMIFCFSLFYAFAIIYILEKDSNLFLIITVIFCILLLIIWFFVWKFSTQLKYLKEEKDGNL